MARRHLVPHAPTTSRASSGRRAGCRASTPPPSTSSGSRSPGSPSAGGRIDAEGARRAAGRDAGRPPAARRGARARALGARRAAQLGARRRVPHLAGARAVVRPAAPAAAVRGAPAVRPRASARGDSRGRRAGDREPRARRRRDARAGGRGRPRRHRRASREVGRPRRCIPLVDRRPPPRSREAQPAASAALERFRAWLEASADRLGPDVIVGREAFTWYLRHVALVTDDPEELVRAGHAGLPAQRRRRGGDPRTRYREVPEAPLAASAEAESAAAGRGRGRGAGVLRSEPAC